MRIKEELKFTSLLIANRGEIAIRIISSAKKLGVKTFVLKTAKEPKALYLKYADQIIDLSENNIGVNEFLDIDTIIGIAKQYKIEAIHPGYGFLAENALFAKRCASENICFIGPTHDVIHKMGNKTIAKEIAIKHKIPVVGGSNGAVNSVEEAIKVTSEIGFPVIIKASSGGGGRGMRIVNSADEIEKLYNLASVEAGKAFNDSSVFIEKYIRNPKHIEFQILADEHGNVVHLGERDCSIQRKHQKLIEEAPAAVLDLSLRKKMGDAAIKIAKAVNYTNAGTIEFLLDENFDFYFMEMNTRIQVEHPVTEAITGLDLIEWQLRIASGQKLSFTQNEIKLTGCAIEFRINAEDVESNFSPNQGTINRINFPKGKHIRIDTGVENGSVITPYFDSMILKIIVSGSNRVKTIANARSALNKFMIEGVKTTVPFFKAVLNNEQFLSGNFNTSFIEKEMTVYNFREENEEMVAALFAALDFYKDEKLENESYIDYKKGKNLSPWLFNNRLK